MNKIPLLVLTLICAQVMTAQKIKVPEFETFEVTYVGTNKNTYYFKTVEHGKVMFFNKLEASADKKVKSGLDLKDNTLIITVKTTFVAKKKEGNEDDSGSASVMTYQKVISLEDIDILVGNNKVNLKDIDDGERN
jgi:hypothetical protein